jgi:phosphoribosylanthranilate isomerase
VFRNVQVKVCGLCSEVDMELARSLGADFFGFIVHAASPRGLSPGRAAELAALVPRGRRVLVDVETPADVFERYAGLDFDAFQVHCRTEVGLGTLAAWSGLAGRERLWLAPRIPPGEPFPEPVLEFAGTVLADSYAPDRAGGTGKTGDWEGFASLRQAHPGHRWVLAGGLGPANIVEALAVSGAEVVDVNSGVESAPGRKDPERMKAFFKALRPA